jgi:hypothetical protein
MDTTARQKLLRPTLIAFGLVFLLGVYPLTVLWPSGWVWHHGRSEYLEMIIAIYATLGIFLILAAREPAQHLSLISFTIWSSVAHGAVMGVQSLSNAAHAGHLMGDVPALFLVAAVLGWLCPEALRPGGRPTRTVP